jgi:hypothetical protein
MLAGGLMSYLSRLKLFLDFFAKNAYYKPAKEGGDGGKN